MDLFGSGFLFSTQSTDANGTAITTPTPVLIGILQELSLDISNDLKELFGQQQDAVDVARGKRKITGKVKQAKISALLWDSVFFGVGLTAGLLGVVGSTTSATIPASPFQITVTPPNSGTYAADLGVIGSSGIELTKVASAPATGQYSQSGAVYTFAAADAGKIVFLNYSYTATVTGAQKQNITNLAMGSAPVFGITFNCAHAGQQVTMSLPSCISGKMALNFKNEDFMVPEIDFQAFYNSTLGYTMQVGYSQ